MINDKKKYRPAIPTEIRRALRAEVEFGCPIHGCRSPFLEYHHFDPTWDEGKQHVQKGMIALCPTHHRKADKGTWTNDQLRCFKQSRNRDPIRGSIDWSINNAVIIVGNNFYFWDSFFLEIYGNEIFSLRLDSNNNFVISAQFLDENLKPLMKIENNDILLNNLPAGDLICSASGNKIKIETKKNKKFKRKTYFEINFARIGINEFTNRLSKLDSDAKNWILSEIQPKIIDGKIMTVVLKSFMFLGENTISIKDNCIEADIKNSLYKVPLKIRDNCNQGGININLGEPIIKLGCKTEKNI